MFNEDTSCDSPNEVRKSEKDEMKKLQYLKKPSMLRLKRIESIKYLFFAGNGAIISLFATQKSIKVEMTIKDKNL